MQLVRGKFRIRTQVIKLHFSGLPFPLHNHIQARGGQGSPPVAPGAGGGKPLARWGLGIPLFLSQKRESTPPTPGQTVGWKQDYWPPRERNSNTFIVTEPQRKMPLSPRQSPLWNQ